MGPAESMVIIDEKEVIAMLEGAIARIREQNAYLSQLDSAVGDGDHGTTMLRVTNVIEKAIAECGAKPLAEFLSDIGWGLAGIDGGATGPLLGSLFLGMSEKVPTNAELNAEALSAMFEGGVAAIKKHTKAAIGDKTMMDALLPAVAGFRSAADAGSSARDCLEKAAQAAQQGAASTTNLVAKIGRAKNLGERSRGVQDPGATSVALMFEGFCEGLKKKEGESRG